jgi:hypothetical protein
MIVNTLLTVALTEENGQRSIRWESGDTKQSLRTDHLDEIISALSMLREQQNPAVSTDDPATGALVDAKLDPRWWMGPEQLTGGALLQIRHPGLGWLAFALSLANLRIFHGGLGPVDNQR